MDVGGWLRGLGLEHYEPAFRENQIDDTVLPSLTADDLRELGVSSVGHRRKLLDAIAGLRVEASAPTPLSEPRLTTDKTAALVQQLDLATVIKVSQAVSSEMVFDKLIDTLMRMAIEQAGAERGVLVFAKTGGLKVAAEATSWGDVVTVRLRDDRVAGDALPESLLNYVQLTQETIVLDDAAGSEFAADPYVRGRRARSILCLPLTSRAKLVGILYLENNLVSGVFASARIPILKLLVSQAAIALENTHLYRELTERERRIRRLVDSNIVGIFTWDLDGRLIEANDALLRIVGYEREDLLAGRLQWDEMTPPEWRERTAQALAELRITGTVQPYEKEYFRKDGSRVPVLLGSARFDETATHGVSFVLDLTERKQAEERLRRNETYLAAAESLNKMGSWAWRPATNEITHWSQGRYRLFGFDPADGLPSLEAVIERIHPEDRALWLETRSLVARGGESDFDFRIVLPDGGTKHVHAVGRPILNQSGEVVEVMGAAADVTDQKRAQEALRESEEQWKAVFENNPTMYFMVDPVTWRILSLNPFGAEQLGYTSDELIGQPIDILFPEADRDRARKNKALCLERLGRTMSWELRKLRKDGSVIWARETGRAMLVKNRPVVLIVSEDITERKKAEVELRESEERFRTLIQFSFDVYWESDEQHRFTRQVFAEGLSDAPAPGSELGKTRWEVPYLEPDEEAWQRHRQTLDAHLPFRDFELARPTPDGGKRYVSVSGLPIFDESGRFVGYRGVGRHITERKKAEVELRESEERFRTLVQFSFDVYWETDAQHRFTRREFGSDVAFLRPQNREWVVAYARPFGKRPWELPFLEPDAEAWRKHREAREAHQPFRDFEVARPAADGGKRYFSISGLPMFDKSGTFIGYRGVARDITDRKKAENELRDSQTKLEAAQRIAHVGWWERDYITNRVSLSDEVCRTFGVRPVDLPEWHGRWLDLIHPDDRARAAKASAEALHGGRRYDLEYRVVRPDGNIRIVHSQGDVTRDDSGAPLRQFGVLQDITELRQTENELRTSEARFRTFVDHATDAFFLHDEQALVVDVNRQACEGLGYSREELIGMHPRVFDVGLDAAAIDRVVEQVRSGQTVSYETLHRRKNGEVFPVEIRLRRLQQGNALFGLGLARDITDRKRAEQRLVAQHRVAQLLANAASIEEATPKVLQALCECLNWDMSALWRIDRGAGVLRCEQVWHKPLLEATEFEAATRASTFERGIGLPGRVWASRAAACIADVADDPGFLRATVAAREGLHAAFAFPILLDGEVIGVIDFVNREVRVPDEELIHAMATIGSQIGQFIERKRAENALLVAQAEIAHISRLTTMGELTASIAHEINQPLTGVLSSGNACLRYLAVSRTSRRRAAQSNA